MGKCVSVSMHHMITIPCQLEKDLRKQGAHGAAMAMVQHRLARNNILSISGEQMQSVANVTAETTFLIE